MKCDAKPTSVPVSIALALMSSMAGADTLTGRVANVSEGDTLILLVGRQPYTIRIAGIDAPERYQAWGDQSKTNLSRLASNRIAVADCATLDQWGHKVCKVSVNTLDIGLEQVKDGMAWRYSKYAKDQSPEDQSAYASAELMAKLRRLGLWGDTNPIPPWRFRGEN
jgi:endonuclease YncB( thermonuclease family)